MNKWFKSKTKDRSLIPPPQCPQQSVYAKLFPNRFSLLLLFLMKKKKKNKFQMVFMPWVGEEGWLLTIKDHDFMNLYLTTQCFYSKIRKEKKEKS